MNIRTLYAAIIAVLLAVWACSEEVIEIPQKEQEESASVISGLLSIKFSEEMAAQIASSDLSGMPLTKSSDVNAFFSETSPVYVLDRSSDKYLFTGICSILDSSDIILIFCVTKLYG